MLLVLTLVLGLVLSVDADGSMMFVLRVGVVVAMFFGMFFSVFDDDVEEGLTVALELHCTNPKNTPHSWQGLGALGCHLSQGLIAKNYIGGNLLRSGKVRAQGFEGYPQSLVSRF